MSPGDVVESISEALQVFEARFPGSWSAGLVAAGKQERGGFVLGGPFEDRAEAGGSGGQFATPPVGIGEVEEEIGVGFIALDGTEERGGSLGVAHPELDDTEIIQDRAEGGIGSDLGEGVAGGGVFSKMIARKPEEE